MTETNDGIIDDHRGEYENMQIMNMNTDKPENLHMSNGENQRREKS